MQCNLIYISISNKISSTKTIYDFKSTDSTKKNLLPTK